MTTLRLPLVSLPKRNLAVDLGDDGVILRLAGLEELGDAGQTAGDVLRLRGLARDLRDDLAGVDDVAVLRRRCSRRPGGGSARRASLFGSLSVSPVFGSLIEMRGRRSAARDSMTTLRERPVTSSSFSIIVTPSTMSPNFTMPPTSVRIGIANGSHSARSWPGLDLVALVDLEDRRRTRGGDARARGRCRRR